MKNFFRNLGFSLLGLLFATAAHAATITVTNTSDNGEGSLRQAIASANNGDMINFNLAHPNTIYLTTQLTLDKSLTIVGPGATKLSLSGNSMVRVLYVSAGTSTISGLTFTSGRVVDESGAGIYIAGSGCVLTLDQCIIRNNEAATSSMSVLYGGGICNHGSLTLNRCLVQDNQVPANPMRPGQGGGLFADHGPIAVYNSTFSNNTGFQGAAITTYNCVATFSNVTVVNNQSSYGGAFFGDNSSNNILTNCTITQNNSQNEAAGLSGYYATIALRNTVVAANVPATPGNTDIFFDNCSLFSLGYNLIGSTGSQTYTWDATDQVGNESSQQAANLQNFADNGGYVRTCLPGIGSSLIDPLSSNSAPWVDARGYLRVNTYDRGAAEHGGTLPVATAATSVGTTGFTANWNTVTGAEGYALDIATNSTFTTMVADWGNSLVGNTTSWNVTGLLSGTTYYYRVRAINGVYLTDHSNTITTTTSIPLPGDVTEDGNADLADAIMALHVLSGLTPLPPANLSGDVNGDFRIGLEEVVYILRKISSEP